MIAGTGLVGDELVVQPGVWEGEPSPNTELQWLCDGAPIAGATGLVFTPGDAEDGTGIACRVTARNVAGEAVAETEAVGILRAAPVVIGVLADVVLAQDDTAQDRQAAAVFDGAALRFSVAGAGAAIDPETGAVTLSTDMLRTAEIVTVTAENSGGAASSCFAVTVLAAPTAVGSLAPVVLAQGVGVATIATVAYFAGSDLAYALVGAPAGVAIDAASGVVTLAIDAALAANLEVRATNAVGAASQSVEVRVVGAPIALGMAGSIVFAAGSGTRTVSMASFFAGQDLTYGLQAAPIGVTIDAVSGQITIPTDAALETALVVRTTNLAGHAIRSVALTVLAAPAVVGTPAPLFLEQGSGAATISAQAFFAGEDLVYSLDAVPAGVTINPSSGLVSVETNTAFTGTITLRATNAAGSAKQDLVMTIGAEGPVREIKPAAPLDGEWTLDQITVQK